MMSFNKTGIAPIEGIKCSCGHEIKGRTTTCPSCKKMLVPAGLQSEPADSPPNKEEESKVK